MSKLRKTKSPEKNGTNATARQKNLHADSAASKKKAKAKENESPQNSPAKSSKTREKGEPAPEVKKSSKAKKKEQDEPAEKSKEDSKKKGEKNGQSKKKDAKPESEKPANKSKKEAASKATEEKKAAKSTKSKEDSSPKSKESKSKGEAPKKKPEKKTDSKKTAPAKKTDNNNKKKSKSSKSRSSSSSASSEEESSEVESMSEEIIEQVKIKKPTVKITKWVVYSSAIDTELIAAAKRLGMLEPDWFGFSQQGGAKFETNSGVNTTTTHVVIPVEEPGRTMKVLEALSRGLFIVTENWLKDSVEAGQWVSEEKYEATKYFPGAKKIRLSHSKSKEEESEKLFDNLTFFVNKAIQMDASTGHVAIENMITRNGGRHVADGADYAIVKNRSRKAAIAASQTEKCREVRIEWLFEALSTFTLPDYKLFKLEKPATYEDSTEGKGAAKQKKKSPGRPKKSEPPKQDNKEKPASSEAKGSQKSSQKQNENSNKSPKNSPVSRGGKAKAAVIADSESSASSDNSETTDGDMDVEEKAPAKKSQAAKKSKRGEETGSPSLDDESPKSKKAKKQSEKEKNTELSASFDLTREKEVNEIESEDIGADSQ